MSALLLNPPDGLGDIPELDPLGLRLRVAADSACVELLRGKVLEDPGRREAKSDRWKLGVRRIPADEVFGALTPSSGRKVDRNPIRFITCYKLNKLKFNLITAAVQRLDRSMFRISIAAGRSTTT